MTTGTSGVTTFGAYSVRTLAGVRCGTAKRHCCPSTSSTGAVRHRSRRAGGAPTSPAAARRDWAPRPTPGGATSAPRRCAPTPLRRPSPPAPSRASSRATGSSTTRSAWAPSSPSTASRRSPSPRSTSAPRASSASCCATRPSRSSERTVGRGVDPGPAGAVLPPGPPPRQLASWRVARRWAVRGAGSAWREGVSLTAVARVGVRRAGGRCVGRVLRGEKAPHSPPGDQVRTPRRWAVREAGSARREGASLTAGRPSHLLRGSVRGRCRARRTPGTGRRGHRRRGGPRGAGASR